MSRSNGGSWARIAVAIAVLAGCGERPGQTGGTGPDRGEQRGARRQRPPRKLSGPRARGVPHGAAIDQVVLTADGRSALTRDGGGGVRLWARLDGTAQPVPIPIRAPAQMSLARHGDDLAAAIVDSAGGTHFLQLGQGGQTTELAALQPSHAVREIALLPGGQRAIALRDDRSIELLDAASGRVLASASRRQFQPAGLILAAGGNSAIAIELLDARQPEPPGIALYRVTWNTTATPPTLTVSDAIHRGHTDLSLLPRAATLSADGSWFAYLALDPPTNLVKVTAVELANGKETVFDLGMYGHERPAIGFGNDRELSVVADGSARGWRIAVDSGRVMPRPMPSSQNAGSAVHAFRGGVHVAGIGTWLYVRDKKTRYLGFEPFEPASAAVSPDNRWVAWTTNRGQVYIESSAGTGDVFRLDAELWNGIWRLAFLGPDHLIASDQVGGLSLIDWRSGEVLARADAGGPIYTLEADAGRGLAVVTRQMGQAWLFEVSVEHGFGGPYVLDDGGVRAGLIPSGGSAVWTLDGMNQRRVYSLTELKKGLTRTEMLARAEKALVASPLAVDADGRVYSLGTFEGRTAVAVNAASSLTPTYLAVSGASVMAVYPSPDGSKVAVLSDSGALAVFNPSTGKRLWSYSLVQNTMLATWSADSSMIAAGGLAGAAVLSADSGRPSSLSCGPWFEVRDTAPAAPFSSQLATMCAR